MIKDNFYDDGGLETQYENYYKSSNSTQINGTTKVSNTQLSDFTTQLKIEGEAVSQDEEANFLSPYVYGWIRKENFPLWYLFSSYGYEVEGGETTYKFTSDEPHNSPVYLMGYRQIGGTADLVNQTARFRWESGEWKPPVPDTNTPRYTLYNRLDNPEWLGMNPIPSNGGLLYCVWTEEENPTESNYHFVERSAFAGTLISSSEDKLNALMNFFNGDGTLDFWFRGSGSVQEEDIVSLRIGDFGNTGIASFTDNDKTYYVAITNAIWANVPQTWYISPPQYATRYMPICLVESEVAEASQLQTGYSPDRYGTDVLYLDTSTHQITGSNSSYMLNGCYPGAYNCEFKDSDISVYQSKVIGNTLLTRTSAFSIQLRLVLKPKSLACALGQYLKFTANASRAWVGTDGGQVLEDEVWYPIYTNDYEITGEFVRGDDPDFASKIADWQIGDLCGNELKKSDIPADGPTPPEPDDPDDPSVPRDDTGNIGLNDITNLSIGGISSFLTAWVLNDQQIINLARRLWSTINSNSEDDAKAMLSNFYKIQHGVNVDYELSLAEIPDYFIGLKWFPFDVSSNFLMLSSGENGIRVGTGATLISTGDAIGGTQFLQGATTQLSGGTITVPYTYESYLDLEPYTSATIYIPYCGTTSVQPSLIMGRTLTITYAISGLTGSICAVVMVSSGSIQYPLCVMNGMVGFDIAISGNTQNAQIRNALTARDNFFMGQWQTISGGTANIGKANAISSALGNFSSGYDNGLSMQNIRDFATDVKSHGLGKALSEAKDWNAGLYNSGISATAGFGIGTSLAKSVVDPILNRMSYVNQLPFTMGTQPLVVGSSSSMANLILPQTAFVQIRRKNRHELGKEAYGNTYGYESKNMKRIGDLTGFIKCVNPKVSISGALQSEMEEIYGLLSTGIYRN